MKIVVTGATGFLGSHLVRLLEERGDEVVSVSRTRGHDIRRGNTLRKPFQDAEVVFHLAALVQSRPGPFEDTNIAGLENVLQASLEAQVKRFIYVSSFTIFGPSSGRPHDESAIPQRSSFFHGYDSTKYHAYRAVQKWKKEIPLNVVFPAVIYGPGPLTEGNIMARLFQRWLMLHMAPLPLYGRPTWNFVYVEDVAQGLVRTLQAEPGEEFVLGGENCSLRQLCYRFRRASRSTIIPVGMPGMLFKTSAYLEDLASRIGGFPPLVIPSTADFFLNDWEFTSALAGSRIGYEPRSIDAGLESTAQWMKQSGLA